MLNKTAAGLGPFSGSSPSHALLASSAFLILLYVANPLWLGAAVELKSASGSCEGIPSHVCLCVLLPAKGASHAMCA